MVLAPLGIETNQSRLDSYGRTLGNIFAAFEKQKDGFAGSFILSSV